MKLFLLELAASFDRIDAIILIAIVLIGVGVHGLLGAAWAQLIVGVLVLVLGLVLARGANK